MENYQLNTDTPLYKVTEGSFIPESNIYLSKGQKVTGQELYLFVKSGKTKNVFHVVKTGAEKYVPWENIVSAQATSSAEGNGNKKYYIVYTMAVPPYYSTEGDDNKEGFFQKLKDLFKPKHNKDVVEMTPEQVKTAYKKSGSKKSMKDWIKGGGPSVFASLSNVAAAILAGQNPETYVPTDTTNTNPTDKSPNANDNKKPYDNTILGLHPVTFGIISLAVLGGLAWIIFKPNKAAKK